MTYATDACAGSNQSFPPSSPTYTVAEEEHLRELLKRCPESTYRAASQYRQTGDPRHLPAILLGILTKYVEPDLRAQLKAPHDNLHLSADLGLDSLTMMEIVILVEDVLAISIKNEELRPLHTLGDVHQFIIAKLGPPASGSR